MALGKIKADTLEHSTAGSLDTQYVVQGSAKAFAHSASNGTSLGSSLNVSSLTDHGSGLYSITFSNNMSAVPAAQYSDLLVVGYNNDPVTTSVVKSQSFSSSFGAIDRANVYYTVHGDLA